MSRDYAVTFSAVSISAAQDVFEITPADDHPIEILGLNLDQTNSTTQEIVGVSIVRGHTSSGSVGSAATPVPLDPGDAAALFTAEVNNTTIAASGSTTTPWSGAWNLLMGLEKWFYDPETRPKANQGNSTIVVRITAPAGARTARGTIFIREH